MLSFNDWVKKEKKGYETKLLDDEPVKKKKEKTIPQMVSDFISIHNN